MNLSFLFDSNKRRNRQGINRQVVKKKELADRAYRSGSSQRAFDLYSEAIGLVDRRDYATRASLFANRAATLESLGRNNDAIRDCEQSLNLKPDFPMVLLTKGRLHSGKGQWDLAIKALETCRNSATALPETVQEATNELVQCRRNQREESLHQQVAGKKELADRAYRSGSFQRAFDLYSEAIGLVDRRFYATRASLFANRAPVLGSLGRNNDAIRDCEQALNLKPDYPMVLLTKGRLHSRLGQWDLAIKALETCRNSATAPPETVQEATNEIVQCRRKQREAKEKGDENERRHKQVVEKKELADRAYRSGSFQRAFDLYSEAIGLVDQRDYATRASLFANRAAALESLERNDDAITDCEQALNLKPDYPMVLLTKGRLHSRLGQWDLAIQALETCRNSATAPPEAVQEATNEIVQCRRKQREAKEEGEEHEMRHQQVMEKKELADRAYRSRSFQRAFDLYSEAIGLVDQRFYATRASLFANRAAALESLGRSKDAIRDCEQALNLKPDYPMVLLTKGRLHSRLGQWDLAIKALETCRNSATAPPETVQEATNEIVQCRRKQREAKEKGDEYERRHQQVVEKKELADRAYRSGSFQRAFDLYSEAIGLVDQRDYATRASLFANRAAALESLGRNNDAITDCDQALNLKPDFPMVLLRKGRLHSGKGQWDLAIKALEICRNSATAPPETVQEATNEIVQCRRRQREVVENERRDPQVVEKKELADRAYRSGSFQRAIDLYSEAIGLVDRRDYATRASLFANRAAALANLGRNNDAIRDCDQALILKPDYPKVLLRKGRLHNRKGQWDLAIQALETCRNSATALPETVREATSELVECRRSKREAQKKADDDAREKRDRKKTEAEAKAEARFVANQLRLKVHYETLGVVRNAHASVIRKAFFKLAREHHPDKNEGDIVSVERFKAIQRAYEVLSNEASRRTYDASL